MHVSVKSVALAFATVLSFAGSALAAPYSVLWFDGTLEWGGQAPDAYRKEMSDSLTSTPGNVLVSTYVSSNSPGGLAAALAGGTYDVVVLDITTAGGTLNAADVLALQNFYANDNKNLLLDGSLYIRNINYSAETDYPGPMSAMDNFTRNEVYEIARRGGGLFFGTDHNCCQSDINMLLNGILPGAAFSGIAAPNTSGTVYGTQLLASIDAVAPLGLFNHWSTEGSQGIPPKGTFTDFLGATRTLYTQVDFPQGGQRVPFVVTSWEPGEGTVIITDPNAPDPETTTTGSAPEPATTVLLGLGGLIAVGRRLRKRA